MPYSEETREHAVRLYKEGATYREVEDEIGCSGASLSRWLDKAGVRGRQRYSEAEKQSAIDIYRDGGSLEDAANEIGCNPVTVSKWLEERGIEKRAPGSGYDNYKYTEEERKRIVEMYDNGRTYREIQGEIGCSSSTIRRAIKDSDVELKGRGTSPKFSPDEEQEILREYEAGATLADLAEKYDSNRVTISEVIKRQGGETRGRGGGHSEVTAEESDEMIRLYTEEKLSQTEIGEKLGYHQSTVGKHLRKAGVRGDLSRNSPTREDHGAWKGGSVKMGDYLAVKLSPDHEFYDEMATIGGYVLEHRLVIAEDLGRPLKDHETVHHLNGDKENNRLENLELRSGKHGKGQSAYCADCRSTDIQFK